MDTLVISLRFVITACVHGCAQSCSTLCNPRDGNRPAPLSMGFSRQEYWSGLPFPPPGDAPHPGINPASPALAGGFFYHWATWTLPSAEIKEDFQTTMGLEEKSWTELIQSIEWRFGGLNESGKGGQTVGPRSLSRVRGTAPRLESSGPRKLPRSGRKLTSSFSEFPAVRCTGPDQGPWRWAHQLTAALFLQPEDPPRQILPSIFLFPGTSWKIPRSKCSLVPSYLFLII